MDEKFQDKNDLIFNNNIIDEKRNQILDMIEETDPLTPVHLENGTWMNFNLLPFLKSNTITKKIKIVEEDLCGIQLK